MIQLLGIPYDKNSSFLTGASLAPQIIRLMHTQGSANAYSELGWEYHPGKTVDDLGNIEFENTAAEENFNIIKNKVKLHIREKKKLLCLGGDHSIAYPIISAYSEVYGKINVLQLDAHGDLYENFENNRYSHASPFARLFEDGCLASLTQAGIRTLTPHQKMQIEKYNVNCYEARYSDININDKIDSPVYITLDMDVFDPAYAPGVSHHEPGGFTSRQVIEMIHRLKVPIIGADIVEYNPTMDWQNMTGMLAYKMMKEIMSKM